MFKVENPHEFTRALMHYIATEGMHDGVFRLVLTSYMMRFLSIA